MKNSFSLTSPYEKSMFVDIIKLPFFCWHHHMKNQLLLMSSNYKPILCWHHHMKNPISSHATYFCCHTIQNKFLRTSLPKSWESEKYAPDLENRIEANDGRPISLCWLGIPQKLLALVTGTLCTRSTDKKSWQSECALTICGRNLDPCFFNSWNIIKQLHLTRPTSMTKRRKWNDHDEPKFRAKCRDSGKS